jgi:hypothetical protein
VYEPYCANFGEGYLDDLHPTNRNPLVSSRVLQMQESLAVRTIGLTETVPKWRASGIQPLDSFQERAPCVPHPPNWAGVQVSPSNRGETWLYVCVVHFFILRSAF